MGRCRDAVLLGQGRDGNDSLVIKCAVGIPLQQSSLSNDPIQPLNSLAKSPMSDIYLSLIGDKERSMHRRDFIRLVGGGTLIGAGGVLGGCSSQYPASAVAA